MPLYFHFRSAIRNKCPYINKLASITFMRFTALLFIIILNPLLGFACTCECTGDCSFQTNLYGDKLVALVKVLAFEDYLDGEIPGYGENMPYSMIVEVVKKYKGSEDRKRIKIWGDNGALCRPYLSQFKIGTYYLISPSILGANRMEVEDEMDYEFFTCSTEFLQVDMKSNMAYGKFSKWKKKISLEKFEKKMGN